MHGIAKSIDFTVTHQGGVLVNTGYIEKESDSIICAYIDLRSKYCEPCGVCDADDGPELMIGLSERSEKACGSINTHNKDAGIVIKFTNHRGWSIFNATISRYTVAITLIKKN